MVMYKHIAGMGDVEMTPEEVTSVTAEWAANDPVKQPFRRQEKTPAEKLAAFLNANPDVKALIED